MNLLGNLGEHKAAVYLHNLGYKLLMLNFATPFGELDIVARDGQTLVFVEVKERATNAYGGPVAAITKRKQAKIARTAAQFIKAHALKYDSIRFDVVAILDGKVEHIKNAFFPLRTTL